MSSFETTPSDLLGRAFEISLIERVVGSKEGAPSAVLFRGEPGVGKTALLDLAARTAREQDQNVVFIHGTEYETDIAYSGLNQAVMALETYVEQLTPEQRESMRVVFGSAEPGEMSSQLAVYSAISSLLAAAGRTRRLLVCLDDVQWMDRVSAEGFLFAARRLDGTPASMIASARSSPGWLDDIAGILVHDVEPLEFESADLLLRQRFPTIEARVRKRLASDAEGNPLALLELPHALKESGRNWDLLPTNLPLTRRLQLMFAERIKSLPDETRDLLLASALDGTGELKVLHRALGDSRLRGLTAAEDAGIVTLTGDRLTFRHPLMRSAVATTATAAEQRAAHGRLADAHRLDIDRRAHHLAAATLEPDEDVAEILNAAARRAARWGSDGDDAAMRLLIRSADLSPSVDDQRRRMAEAAFIGAFRYASPSPELITRFPDSRPGSDEALWAASASVFMGCHRMNDLNLIFRLLSATLNAAVSADNTASDAYAMAVEALFLVCTFSDNPSHLDRFEASIEVIPDSRNTDQLRALMAGLDPARAAPELLSIVDHVIENAVLSPDPHVIGIASGGAIYLDRLTLLMPALERVAGQGPNGEGGGDLPVRAQLTIESFLSGRWDEALRFAQGSIALSAARSTQLGTTNSSARLATVIAARGDSRAAADIADTVLSNIAGRGYAHIEHEVHFALMLDAVGREDHAAAFSAASTLSKPGEFPPNGPLALWAFFDLVSSAIRLGKISDAARHVEEVGRLKISTISPHYALMVAASEAMLQDRGESSAAYLGQFLEHPEVPNWPFDLARVRLVQAEFLIAAGRSVEASDQIARAVLVLRGLGAVPWIEIADRLSNQILGVAQKSNALGLTVTELKVVRLAASGLTNKQIGAELFLSARTVASHLYRAFPKLGITRRAALRDAVARIDKNTSTRLHVDAPDVEPSSTDSQT